MSDRLFHQKYQDRELHIEIGTIATAKIAKQHSKAVTAICNPTGGAPSHIIPQGCLVFLSMPA